MDTQDSVKGFHLGPRIHEKAVKPLSRGENNELHTKISSCGQKGTGRTGRSGLRKRGQN